MIEGLPIDGVRVVVTKGVPARDECGRLVLYVHPDTVRELARRRRETRRLRRQSRPFPTVGGGL